VAWMFEIIGPNYIALRFYFFAICAITAVMSFLLVRRSTGCGALSLAAGILAALIPGMLFRNYMAFMAVINALALVHIFARPPETWRKHLAWIAFGGLALALTYLIRIDLGVFFTFILLGCLLLHLLWAEGKPGRRAVFVATVASLYIVLFVAAHTPFYLDAKRRGFGHEFVDQYAGWARLILYHVGKQLPREAPTSMRECTGRGQYLLADTSATPTPTPESPADPAKSGNVFRARPRLSDALNLPRFYDRAFVLILHLPIPLSILLSAGGATAFLISWRRRDPDLRARSLCVLISTGAALTLFPQYFFFRPDTPHLSEFMVPFFSALAIGAWHVGALAFRSKDIVSNTLASLFIGLCVADASLYIYHSYPKESAGTIAARHGRKSIFKGENGVRVLLKENEAEENRALYDTVKRYSEPDEFVVCYPYCPTINFMTNRRSYEYNLYMDDGDASPTFHDYFMGKVALNHPALIIIDNRDINRSEHSRFRNWASRTYEAIRHEYRYLGTFRKQEVYARPDKIPDGTHLPTNPP